MAEVLPGLLAQAFLEGCLHGFESRIDTGEPRIEARESKLHLRVKRAAGRPKDLEMIAELEALLEEQRG